MEINDILKLIEAVSEHGLTSFVLEENGSKISMKKEKEVITVTAAPAVQTVIAPAAADARDISGTAPSVPAGYMAPAVSATGTEMSVSYTHLMALEDEYSVEIPAEDLQNLLTVGDVMNYLKEKGVEA